MMKPIDRNSLIQFELVVMDFAEACEVKTKDDLEWFSATLHEHLKDDLEWFSATLHEHLETAIQDYAMDEEIEDYEPQY